MIVRVNINDVNDNAPVFETETDEIVASVPTTAQYGHHVTRIEVIVQKLLVCVTPISVSIFPVLDDMVSRSLFQQQILVFTLAKQLTINVE